VVILVGLLILPTFPPVIFPIVVFPSVMLLSGVLMFCAFTAFRPSIPSMPTMATRIGMIKTSYVLIAMSYFSF
jgi:hypothetical protein